MCGIVGYIGSEQAAPILLQGLEKLEYRGYDSAGVAVYSEDGLRVAKAKGRLRVLSNLIDGGKAVAGTLGIGHPVADGEVDVYGNFFQAHLFEKFWIC